MIDNEKRLRSLIHQLHEHEGLTSALIDRNAKTVLAWGEQQIREGMRHPETAEDIDDIARQVRRILRTMNDFIENRAEMSDSKALDQLLRLVAQSMWLARLKSGSDHNTPPNKTD